MDKEIKTDEIIEIQEKELELVELKSILAEKENEIIKYKEEMENLRLHNQKLYSRQVVSSVEETKEETYIDPKLLRGIW